MKNKLEHNFRRFFFLAPATISCLSVLFLNFKALEVNLATHQVKIHAEQVLIEPAAASIAGNKLNDFINNTQGKLVGIPSDPNDNLKLKGECVTLSKSFLDFLGLPNPWRVWANDKGFNFSEYSMSLFKADQSKPEDQRQNPESIMDFSGRASNGQAFTASFVSNVEDLQAGDLVATKYMPEYNVSHTGIATGNKDPNHLYEFEIYDQNWPTGDSAGKDWISKTRFYGAIRIRFANEAKDTNYLVPILQLLLSN